MRSGIETMLSRMADDRSDDGDQNVRSGKISSKTKKNYTANSINEAANLNRKDDETLFACGWN